MDKKVKVLITVGVLLLIIMTSSKIKADFFPTAPVNLFILFSWKIGHILSILPLDLSGPTKLAGRVINSLLGKKRSLLKNAPCLMYTRE